MEKTKIILSAYSLFALAALSGSVWQLFDQKIALTPAYNVSSGRVAAAEDVFKQNDSEGAAMPTNLATAPLIPLSTLDWERVETTGGVKYKNGDFIVRENETLHLAPLAIHQDDLATSSVNSRAIKNYTIRGRDIAQNANLDIASLTLSQGLSVSGDADIMGDLTVSGAITGSFSGSFAPTSDVDMLGYVMTNIGNSGTDFTTSGGLNLAGTLGIQGLAYAWPSVHADGVLSNDGTGTLSWQTLGAASITSDSLDFSEFTDAMTLDASTDILVTGSNVFSLTNTGTGNSFLVNDGAGDTTPFVIDASGNVGIGTATPTSNLHVEATGANASPVYSVARTSTAGGNAWSLGAESYSSGSQNISQLWSAWTYQKHDSSGVLGQSVGLYVYSTENTGGGSIADNYGIKIEDQSAATNNYSIHTNQSAGANNYAIYNAGTAKSYFAGNVGIGTMSPGSLLHVSGTQGIETIQSTTNDTASLLKLQGNLLGNNQAMGQIQFNTGSTVLGQIAGYGGASASHGYLTFSTRQSGTLTEVMRIDSTGNVGIGNSSPGYNLDIGSSGSSPAILRVAAPGSTASLWLSPSSSNPANIYYGTPAGSAPLTFASQKTGIGEVMRITSAGNVGIGTTNPGNKLVVAGASTDTTTVHLDSGGHAYSQIDSGDNTYESLIRFMDGGSTRFTMGLDNDSAHTVFSIGDNALTNKWLNVTNTGNVGIGTTGSGIIGLSGTTVTINGATGGNMELTYGGTVKGYLKAGASDFTIRGYLQPLYLETQNANDIILRPNTTEAMRITSAGNVGIGDTTPDGLLDVEPTGVVTAASYGLNLSNLTTNATTDGINKYGVYLTSTGTWTGSAGTATNNYGLYVDTVSGAENNYGAYIAGNVGIGTTSPTQRLDVGSGNILSTGTITGRYLSANHSSNFRLVPLVSPVGFGPAGVMQVQDLSGNYNTILDSNSRGIQTLGIYVDGINSNNYFAGNVGIGTTSPATLLHVSAATTGANLLRLANTTTGENNEYTFNIDSLKKLNISGGGSGNDSVLFENTMYIGMGNSTSVGIGDTTPDGLLDVEPTGVVTAASYGLNLSNLTTNATTDGINKYGAYLTSTGTWTGSAGTATNNYGLYVGTVSGADNNYGAYFAQPVAVNSASFTDNSGNLALGVKMDTSLKSGIFVTDNFAQNSNNAYIAAFLSNDTLKTKNGVFVGRSTYEPSATPATPAGYNFASNNVTSAGSSDWGGMVAKSQTVSVATTGTIYGFNAFNYVQGTAAQSNYVGYYSGGQFAVATPTVASIYDIKISNYASPSTGAVTNRYGLYMDFTNSGITNAYGVYQVDSSVKNYFGGNVGIGTTSPSASLHISKDSVNFEALRLSRSGTGAGDVSFNVSTNGGLTITAGNNVSLQSGGSSGTSFLTYQSNILALSTSLSERMRIDSAGNVGIGDTTPDGKLDFDLLSTSTTGASEYGANFTLSDTGIVTTGTDTTYGSSLSVTRTGATGGTINNYGEYITLTGDTGGTSTNTGLAVTVSGADTNYAATFMGGNVGIGDTSPAALFTVGNGDLFQVSSTGNVSTTGQINGTDGLVTKVNAGACDDTTFTLDTNGNLCIDSTNSRIYYRYGDAWHYSAQTAGFQIPNYESYAYDFESHTFDTARPLEADDFLMPFVENFMEDGAAHGLYARFSDVKDTLLHDEKLQISDLTLKTNQNITTLAELQVSVDDQLVVVGNALTKNEEAIKNQEDATDTLTDGFATLQDTVDTQADLLGQLAQDANTSTSQTALLKSQVEVLTEQITALTDFYTTLDLRSLGLLLTKDEDGNIDLLDGKLRAKILETGTLTIEVVDTDGATIGRDKIETGATTVKVKTTSVKKGSHIIVTPRTLTTEPLSVTDVTDDKDFTVEIPNAAAKDISFDWWIVEER